MGIERRPQHRADEDGREGSMAFRHRITFSVSRP
jgi:hypothetical protein